MYAHPKNRTRCLAFHKRSKAGQEATTEGKGLYFRHSCIGMLTISNLPSLVGRVKTDGSQYRERYSSGSHQHKRLKQKIRQALCTTQRRQRHLPCSTMRLNSADALSCTMSREIAKARRQARFPTISTAHSAKNLLSDARVSISKCHRLPARRRVRRRNALAINSN